MIASAIDHGGRNSLPALELGQLARSENGRRDGENSGT
jgi:hypothetical protein